MKKVILMTVAVLVVLTVSSCRKETEKIIERVEVQKGNQILSGIGAPAENIGNVGDYYLDLSNTNLYGAKTKQGWGTPINLEGIQVKKATKVILVILAKKVRKEKRVILALLVKKETKAIEGKKALLAKTVLKYMQALQHPLTA